MPDKTKKATFNLHVGVLAELDKAIAQGDSPSKNALVEQALVKELNELKRKNRQKLWREAAQDPVFLKDVKDVEADFLTADTENIGRAD